METVNLIIGIVGLVLAVIGIIIAVWAMKESKNDASELKTVLEKSKESLEKISKYEQDSKQELDLLKRETQKITIQADSAQKETTRQLAELQTVYGKITTQADHAQKETTNQLAELKSVYTQITAQAQAAHQETRGEMEALRKATAQITSQADIAQQELGKLVSLTDKLSNTVQTRAIGHFPENLRAIIRLISETKKSLLIATDVASYGQLSNPEECLNYYSALIALAARQVNVEVIAYSGTRADQERRQQFRDYVAQGDSGLQSFVSEDRWIRFAKRNHLATVKDFPGVFRALLYTDLRFRRDLVATGGIPVFELSEPQQSLPVFFWLRDGEEAIFSLFTFGEKSREISFRTVDQSITDILAATFTSLRKHADATEPALDLTSYRDLLTSPHRDISEASVVEESRV